MRSDPRRVRERWSRDLKGKRDERGLGVRVEKKKCSGVKEENKREQK